MLVKLTPGYQPGVREKYHCAFKVKFGLIQFRAKFTFIILSGGKQGCFSMFGGTAPF